eukprot:358875-Chlamydomonas_euryale.AAC.2
MRKAPVVAPLFGTFGTRGLALFPGNREVAWPHKIDSFKGFSLTRDQRNVPWTGRPGKTVFKTLLCLNLRSPNRLEVSNCLALAVAGVAVVAQPFLACDPVAGE